MAANAMHTVSHWQYPALGDICEDKYGDTDAILVLFHVPVHMHFTIHGND